MPLTPDQIEQHTFSLVAQGYEPEAVRKFLLEVAATVRLALHTTNVTAATAASTPPPPPADPFERVGAEVAGVLRAAEDAANALRVEAEEEAAALRAGAEEEAATLRAGIGAELRALRADAETEAAALRVDARADVDAMREDARREAAEIRRLAEAEAVAVAERASLDADAIRQRAETDALAHHDRARRLLTAAQEQADAIVAEAEAQSRAVLVTAREQADEHIRQVVLRARAHAEDVLKAERDALRRLHEVQAQLASAVEVLQHAEHRPVVDLTATEGTLRLGNLDVAAPAGTEPADAGVEVRDPLVGMVRAAVDRAVEHSSRPTDDEPAGV